MHSARSIIADVVDFWMEGRGEIDAPPHLLGEHNADRVLSALHAADWAVVPGVFVRAAVAQIKDTGPAHSGKPTIDIREFVAGLEAKNRD